MGRWTESRPSMRKPVFLMALLAAALVGLAVWAIADRPSWGPEWSTGRNSSAAIANWVSSAADNAVLDMRSVVPLPWDYFIVFGPYTSRDQIDQTLGFQWTGASHSSIDVLDGVALVVFIRGDTVVSAFEHPRDKGDFAAGRVPTGVRLTEPRTQILNQADAWRTLAVPGATQGK